MQNQVCFYVQILWWSICFAGTTPPVRAQNSGDWQLEKGGTWIQVYSRFVPGNRLKEMKVHCEMTGNLTQLVALLSDVDNYQNVIYKTKTARLIRRVSETEFCYYSETEMPWPAKNRDLIVQIRFAYNRQTKVLQINANDMPDAVPPKPGVVRVPVWVAVWYVRPTAPDRMVIDYTFQVDPGGTLPAWLINMTAAIGPYQSFQKLQESIGLPCYQNRSFQFMTKPG